MITKGIVVEIIDAYNLKVRIPLYDRASYAVQATPDSELSIATICTLPNYQCQFKVGDVVFIGFEDQNIAKPIILGKLFYNENTDNQLYNNSTVYNITAVESANLPVKTTIGNITSDELLALKNITGNIQLQIDRLAEQLSQIQSLITNKE